jgi:hypothetical protein
MRRVAAAMYVFFGSIGGICGYIDAIDNDAYHELSSDA